MYLYLLHCDVASETSMHFNLYLCFFTSKSDESKSCTSSRCYCKLYFTAKTCSNWKLVDVQVTC